MRKLFALYWSFVNTAQLRWASHYSRVTGKPAPSGFSFSLYNSITQAPGDVWDKANDHKDIFLSSPYLSALEQAPPENMSFRYAIISKENVPVGIAYFQILELNYRLHQSAARRLSLREKNVFRNIHDKLIGTASVRLLICGNAMISGEHGYSMSAIPNDVALHVIAEIAYTLRKSVNPRITVTLIKDFYKQNAVPATKLSQFGFHAFDAGPNMVVPIRNNWTGFDKYLSAMKSKYRKRAAGVIKKGSALQRQSLGLDELVCHKDELYKLYCQVADNAKFKIFFLSPDYFIELKRRLGDMFVCEGYFLNSTMVGFTTRIFNTTIVEGYAHGLLYGRNKEFELYQNFMLDDVSNAIAMKLSQVNTGRTSMAMKSSIGAIPKDMVCYLRFSSGHSNQFVKPLLYFVKPSDEYCRNPFE